jgi:hypothetical protein
MLMSLRPAVLAGLLAGVFAFLPLAPEAGEAASESLLAETRQQSFSGPPERPRRHLRVSEPASLAAEEAEAVYLDLRAVLAKSYAAAGDAAGTHYQDWTRHNRAPFASATHGRRYVNVYANDLARAYGRSFLNRFLPVGAVVAKDSFVVTGDGAIAPGPLFVMEKMPGGFNYVTGDWRYSMITPEGKLAGQTLGEGAEKVEFCIACHLAREAQDHLFFVPPDFRLLN